MARAMKNSKDDFITYSYPLLNCLFGIDSDKVIMRYKVKIMVVTDSGFQEAIVDRLVVSSSEEMADKLMRDEGVIIFREHLYQELQKLEDAYLKQLAINGENALAAIIKEDEPKT